MLDVIISFEQITANKLVLYKEIQALGLYFQIIKEVVLLDSML